MANLMRKTKEYLVNVAMNLKLSTAGTKADIVQRIEEHERDGVTPGHMLGSDLKPTPIKKKLADRASKAAKERAALEKRVKKRGGTVGEAQ